jgi:negative modulator of initiation of replication
VAALACWTESAGLDRQVQANIDFECLTVPVPPSPEDKSMPTLHVDEDVCAYLLRNTSRFGETESEILRRLLGLPNPQAPNRGTSGNGKQQPIRAEESNGLALLEFVRSGEFRVASDATKRYLAILGKAFEQNADRFGEVRDAVAGRNRIYFSRDRAEISRSGRSAAPQQIPGSPYWALTNENVARKRRMLRQVLEFLEYPSTVIEDVVSTLPGR